MSVRLTLIGIALVLATGFLLSSKSLASGTITTWWPVSGVMVSGTQPFKALVPDLPLGAYRMFWQVDNGQYNGMTDSYADYPHKESEVDLTGWTWHGSGPYAVTFIAQDPSGTTIASAGVTIYTGPVPTSATILTPTPTPSPIPSLTPSPAPVPPTVGSGFFVNPVSNAQTQYLAWQYSRPTDAGQMLKIAGQPQASWFGGWNTDVTSDVSALVAAASKTGTIPVMVLYNIPGRDCGGYSQGGANTADGYTAWIGAVAAGIGGHRAWVILEPDALANLDCLTPTQQSVRYSLIASAVRTLKSAGAAVYIDAGNPTWISASVMASRLKTAGVGSADGFSLNVSNFFTTADNITYGTSVSSQTGGKHFVIDTGRNGNGPTPDNQWCNPPGRALGTRPTRTTGNPLADAFLWIKDPGESDGTCNGGPAAGTWWPDYALGLAQRAAY